MNFGGRSSMEHKHRGEDLRRRATGMMAENTTYDTIVADHELNALAQQQVNAAFAREPGSVRTLVRLLADAKHKQWPQYQGHWDGAKWEIYVITQRVQTKGGVAFEIGDYAIGWRAQTRAWMSDRVTLYSIRNGIDTSVASWSCRLVGC